MGKGFQLDRSTEADSIHQQLVDGLSAEFALLPPGDPLPGAKELQQRFGVAYMTITRALDELVLRNEIVRFRGKGSFTASSRVRKIYYLQIAPDEIKPYFSPELEGACEQARISGIKIQNFPIANYDTVGLVDWDLMKKLPLHVPVVISSLSNFHGVLDFLLERQCQLVVLNDLTDRCRFDAERLKRCHQVVRNRFKQIIKAVSILADSNCKKILLIHEGPTVFNPIRSGYQAGLQENHLQYDPELELFCQDNYAMTKNRFEVMMQMRPDIDAIITTYASQALAVYNVLQKLRRSVPQQISLLTLEDSAALAMNQQGITSVNIDRHCMGKLAVQLLAGNHPQPVCREVPIVVNYRETVKVKI